MKYRLKKNNPSGDQIAFNHGGTYYRLTRDEFKDFPPEVVEFWKHELEPESNEKSKTKEKNTDGNI